MIDAVLLLPKILARAGDDRELSESAAKIAWSRVTGEGLRQHTAAIRLNDKKLIVAVADAVWQKQLQSMSAELIFRMNKLLRSNVVNSLEFQINPKALRGRDPSLRQETAVKREPLPPSVIASAAEIEDTELRERFMRAAENCISRRDVRFTARNPGSKM